MKRFILSASLVALGMAALAPIASARQLSSPREISDTATIHQLVLFNRDARAKK